MEKRWDLKFEDETAKGRIIISRFYASRARK
jgi:hypothetical protein